MTPEEWQRNEANRWLALAAKDLHAAWLMTTEEPSASVFHSQQCAEKSEKPLLSDDRLRGRLSLPTRGDQWR